MGKLEIVFHLQEMLKSGMSRPVDDMFVWFAGFIHSRRMQSACTHALRHRRLRACHWWMEHSDGFNMNQRRSRRRSYYSIWTHFSRLLLLLSRRPFSPNWDAKNKTFAPQLENKKRAWEISPHLHENKLFCFLIHSSSFRFRENGKFNKILTIDR